MTVINTNVKSLVAASALTVNERFLATAMEQLSTGKRINGAKDDAAGQGSGENAADADQETHEAPVASEPPTIEEATAPTAQAHGKRRAPTP